MVAGGCMVGGCAWLSGGVHSSWGACMVAGGHAWLPGACMVARVGMHRIRQDTVNEQAVHILLECILGYLLLPVPDPWSSVD